MSNNINNGGPAFPLRVPQEDHVFFNEGMTMRDYFAAKAMLTLMREEKEMSYDDIAAFAYAMADSMLYIRGGK